MWKRGSLRTSFQYRKMAEICLKATFLSRFKPLKPCLTPSSAPTPCAVPGSFSPCPRDNARLFPGVAAEQDLWLWLIQTTCKSVIECLKNNRCYNSSEEQTNTCILLRVHNSEWGLEEKTLLGEISVFSLKGAVEMKYSVLITPRC